MVGNKSLHAAKDAKQDEFNTHQLFPHCDAGITDTANAMICSGAGKSSSDAFPAPQSSREYGVPRPLGWCQRVST